MELSTYRQSVLSIPLARYFDSTDSTNLQAKELARNGAEDGTTLFANMQTAGRGRLTRTWLSEANRGIYMSLITRPEALPSHRTPELSFWAALAVCDAIDSALEKMGCVERAALKWPNDVLLCGKKVCGILAETGLTPEGTVCWAVTGIGINVQGTQFPPELPWASSLEGATGCLFSRGDIAKELVDRLAFWKAVWLQKGFSLILKACGERMVTLNKRVRAESDGQGQIGMAIGLGDDGSLLLQTDDGQIHALRYGEVSVRGLMGYI